jgi:hypothetical protein
MNAREVGGGVSGYEGRKKRKRGSVMWDTLDLVRRNLGAGSVMEFATLSLGTRVLSCLVLLRDAGGALG